MQLSFAVHVSQVLRQLLKHVSRGGPQTAFLQWPLVPPSSTQSTTH
jgi:hypothetical protein